MPTASLVHRLHILVTNLPLLLTPTLWLSIRFLSALSQLGPVPFLHLPPFSSLLLFRLWCLSCSRPLVLFCHLLPLISPLSCSYHAFLSTYRPLVISRTQSPRAISILSSLAIVRPYIHRILIHYNISKDYTCILHTTKPAHPPARSLAVSRVHTRKDAKWLVREWW